MKKKFLSLALALALCLGLTVSAAAATITEIMSPDTWDSVRETGSVYFGDGLYCGYGGAIDTNGNIIIPPGSYEIPYGFSDGFAWAKRDGNWYIVDKTGRELGALPAEDWSIHADVDCDFHEGLSMVYSNKSGKYGYVDTTGRLVIPCEYDARATGIFSDGLAVCYDAANAYYGYMDKTGRVVIPCQYAEAKDFVNGFGVVKLGNRWTVIDTTGKELLPQDWFYGGYTGSDYWKYIGSEVVPAGGQGVGYAYLNRSGQIVSSGFAEVSKFQNGMACVKKDYKYGYVNEAGVLVIPCQYDSYGTFRDGYAVMSTREGNSIIIDKTGKVTATVSTKYLDELGNGCFKISSSESGRTRYGVIDYTGREIVPCKYAEIGRFSGGVAPVQNFDNKWGFVDTNGAEIVPCKLLDEPVYTNEPGIFEVWNYNDDGRRSIIKSSGWTEPAVSAPAAPSTPAQPSGVSAAPTASTVLVNGESMAFDAYNIGGSNYFKLRDLAHVLNGTEKQFEVGWDSASKTITLTSGQSYTANGSEMAAKGSGAQKATVSASRLLIDGREVSLTAYNIGGNNYFKLRDIGQVFNFGIGWDNASKTITIDTSTGYTS